ncbi:MAG: class I SAM-dependent methyltransferase [Pseudomonadota bacterium]|nr:class I SAM-dependent methyltransferase [Pseudomonadota bacterium]
MASLKSFALQVLLYPREYISYLTAEKRLLAKFLERKRSKKLLDVGCGEGRLAQDMSMCVHGYEGIDYDREMILTCLALKLDPKEAKFRQLDATKLTSAFRPKSFDNAVLAWNTLGNMPGKERKVLRGLRQVVSGKVFVSVVAAGKKRMKIRKKYYKKLGIRCSVEHGHPNVICSKAWGRSKAYSPADLRRIARESGYRIESMEYVGTGSLGLVAIFTPAEPPAPARARNPRQQEKSPAHPQKRRRPASPSAVGRKLAA